MKVQIRRGVFETNSSSVHTLTICLEPVNIKKYAGMTFKLGIPWNERQTNNKIQERLDSLFNYMTMNDSLTNFIYCKNRISKVISKYEIKFDYLIDENGEVIKVAEYSESRSMDPDEQKQNLGKWYQQMNHNPKLKWGAYYYLAQKIIF